MLKKNSKNTKYYLTVLTVTVGLLLSGTASAAGLSDVESDGYLQWLHSLGKTVESRLENNVAEANLLFPFDQPGWVETEIRPYRHLAISKALTELEAEYGNREAGRLDSAMIALLTARNYVNISEYDSALVWFDTAKQLDKNNSFNREISYESLASSIAARDSIGVEKMLLNTLGTIELIGRETELILAYRWLLTNRDSRTIEVLSKKIESQQVVLSDRLRFWHAYAYAWCKKTDESLVHLRKLIQSGGLSRDLTESQRAWVLIAIPDILFIQGDKKTAGDLYTILAGSDVQAISLWSEYQIANLQFLRADYLKASTGFLKVCEASRVGSWQDQACEMAKVAEQLHKIKSEGEPYGTASYYKQ